MQIQNNISVLDVNALVNPFFKNKKTKKGTTELELLFLKIRLAIMHLYIRFRTMIRRIPAS